MLIFKEISIYGLFGENDVHIPIKDNRLILVGYNGIGKSTILNIFYYFISQQWSKLADQDFSTFSVKLKNKGRRLTIDRADLSEFLHLQRRHMRYSKGYRHHTPNMLREAVRILESEAYSDHDPLLPKSSSHFRKSIYRLKEELRIPIRLAEELVRDARHITQDEFDFGSEAFSKLSEIDTYLSENLAGRILYLPTYRRIEKDIKTVFPEIEEELQRKLSRRSKDFSTNENYIELVQFGMEDVKSKITSRLETIKAYALSQINSLTTRYLRDVIRDEANQYEEVSPTDVSEESLATVFTKVDSSLLNEKDKEKIIEVVQKIREGRDLLENEKYVAHYVLYLVQVGNNISEKERSIVDFIEICNSYLYGKSFSFDNVGYEVLIKHTSGRPVEMEELSSGEKQIVSLFSHLILDDQTTNYIVIDEPELSLSVDWQQRFLEDISNLDTCNFIGAVTHSPFIFDNSLDENTVDLLEQTTESK